MTSMPFITGNLTDEQRAVFYAQMPAVEKDEVAGVLLALFLGTFGAHHFYLRRTGLGILYVLFSWSGIPTLVGFIECFFMPQRVRQYNAEQAAVLAANLQYAMPGKGATTTPLAAAICPSCESPLVPGVKFCARCGAAVSNNF